MTILTSNRTDFTGLHRVFSTETRGGISFKTAAHECQIQRPAVEGRYRFAKKYITGVSLYKLNQVNFQWRLPK